MKSFEKGRKILQILSDLGHESYFVGGALRDYILKRELNDIDIATPLRPEEIMCIFPKTVPIGLKHGTVLVLFEGESFEVTTFRTEGTYTDFRHPDKVRFVKDIRQDLSRRDFTVNALAMDRHFQIFDPFGGQKDIAERKIRAVGDARLRFSEDPLRILRAFRFCSQLGFQLEEKTKEAAKENMPLLRHISVERIQVEMEKLLSGAYVQSVWALLEAVNLAENIPLGHTERRMGVLAQYNFMDLKTAEERWACLYFLLHITDGTHQLNKWKFSNQKRNRIVLLVDWLERKGQEKLTPFEIYTLGLEQAVCFARTQAVCFHDSAEKAAAAVRRIWQDLPIHSKADIKYNGQMILAYTKKRGGPWLGALLQDLERDMVQGICPNERTEIERWMENWLQKYKKEC